MIPEITNNRPINEEHIPQPKHKKRDLSNFLSEVPFDAIAEMICYLEPEDLLNFELCSKDCYQYTTRAWKHLNDHFSSYSLLRDNNRLIWSDCEKTVQKDKNNYILSDALDRIYHSISITWRVIGYNDEFEFNLEDMNKVFDDAFKKYSKRTKNFPRFHNICTANKLDHQRFTLLSKDLDEGFSGDLILKLIIEGIRYDGKDSKLIENYVNTALTKKITCAILIPWSLSIDVEKYALKVAELGDYDKLCQIMFWYNETSYIAENMIRNNEVQYPPILWARARVITEFDKEKLSIKDLNLDSLKIVDKLFSQAIEKWGFDIAGELYFAGELCWEAVVIKLRLYESITDINWKHSLLKEISKLLKMCAYRTYYENIHDGNDIKEIRLALAYVNFRLWEIEKDKNQASHIDENEINCILKLNKCYNFFKLDNSWLESFATKVFGSKRITSLENTKDLVKFYLWLSDFYEDDSSRFEICPSGDRDRLDFHARNIISKFYLVTASSIENENEKIQHLDKALNYIKPTNKHYYSHDEDIQVNLYDRIVKEIEALKK